MHGYVLLAVRVGMPPELAPHYEVEDLASLAWVSILQNLKHLEVRGDGPLHAWLRRIVITRLLDARKRLQAGVREARKSQSLDEILLLPEDKQPHALAAESSHVRDFWLGVEAQRVVAAIQRLPQPQREIMWLVDFDGCTLAEAATLAGISKNAARYLHATAKARVAATLRARS